MNTILPYIRPYIQLWFIIVCLFFVTPGCENPYHKEFDNVPNEQKKYVDDNASEKENYENKTAPLIQNPIVSEGLKRIAVRDIGPLREVLNDSNAKQLEAAQRIGIEPVEDIRSAYRTKRPIIKIVSCADYEVDDLKHSLPFLVPEAAKLLADIGKNFNDSLKVRGGEGYKIKVTSLLRTPHTVKKLRRVNVNATDVSTHKFATTFDISYTKFHKYGDGEEIHDGDLKNLLAEILNNMRTEGKCYVKFERHTSCFHVTCR